MSASTDWVFGLVGAGGFAREVMPIVLKEFATNASAKLDGHVYFVESNPMASTVNGIPCISEDEFFALQTERRMFNVAVADSAFRQVIAERCIERGAEPLSLQASSAEILSNNHIQEGAIFCGHSMVTTNAQIGRFFHANIYSYVAHDCVIGDYVTFAPNVHCNGNVHIEDYAYIGAGAVLKQGSRSKPLAIGVGAVVGMGAVVTKDVPPHTTVVGNPARPMTK